ncbi:hypothetical protein C8A05DRAFT_39508, partial [Staphylotrichum tortipilum]
MDAVSGGASVIAFITLAAQSAKAIYDLLSGIKDTPDNVRRAVDTVSMLQWALKQLAQCGQTSGIALPAGIEDQLKMCSANLSAYASTLAKLQALDTDSRGRRAWKRVKAVLDEKELGRMTEVLAAHSSALSLTLQSTQLAALHGGRGQISQLSHEISTSLQENSTRWNTVQAEMTGIRTTLTRVDTRREEQWESFLQSLTRSFQAQPNTEFETKFLKDAKLQDCINRLLRHASQENRTVSADDVDGIRDGIVDDLQYVLEAINDQCGEVIIVKNLKRMGGVLASTPTLSINSMEDLEDMGSDERREEAVEDEGGDGEALDCSHGVEDSEPGQFDTNIENSNTQDSDAEHCDADDSNSEDTDSEGSDAENADDMEGSDDDEEE